MPRADKRPKLTTDRIRDSMRVGEWLSPNEISRRLDFVHQSFLNKLLRDAVKEGLLKRITAPDSARQYVYARTDGGGLERVGQAYPSVLWGPGVPDAAQQIGEELRTLWKLNAR